MAGDDRDDFGIGALGSHTNRVHGDRSRATSLQIDEPAMVRQPPISEKPRTLDVYTQAVTPAKHAAQATVMSLVFLPISQEGHSLLDRKLRVAEKGHKKGAKRVLFAPLMVSMKSA
jgi:hypothetical protein